MRGVCWFLEMRKGEEEGEGKEEEGNRRGTKDG